MAFVTFTLPVSRTTRPQYSQAARTPICAAQGPGNGLEPAQISRRAVLSGIALAALAVAVPSPVVAEEEVTTASGLKYKISKKGTGPKIAVGDLVAIRFKGTYNDVPFDDLFETSQPYFYRAGSELVMKVCRAVPYLSFYFCCVRRGFARVVTKLRRTPRSLY